MSNQNKGSELYKGIIYIVFSAFFFALMSVFVRFAGDIPSIQKSFFRNLISFFIALFALFKSGKKTEIRKGDMKFLLGRAIFGTIGILCNFYAVDNLLLSDASMLNKISPFFSVVFSYLLLKERISLPQAMAVVTAFLGTLFIIKPSAELFENPAALIGLLGGICAGAAYTFVRALGLRKVEKSFIVLFFSAFSCLATLPFLIADFHPMTLKQLLFLIAAGIAAAGGQFSVTSAYCYAPAKEVSVYSYSQLFFSMIFGFVFFSQLPDILSIIGYVIITATAVGIFIYNKKKQSS
ncbi:MAG: DMT family transporter [Ruminococcus sp.]|nr:DMT family transporter [Ruminococcus sp.]